MTWDQCQGKRKMMGRGAEEEERPFPVSRAPGCFPANLPAGYCAGKSNLASLEIGFYAQARKALAERSPFDEPEDGSVPSSIACATLPSGLASLLKSSGSKKKLKNSNSETKTSRLGNRSRSRNFWVETEDYFRGMTLPDVDTLCDVSSLSPLVNGNMFSIPPLGNVSEKNAGYDHKVEVENSNGVEMKDFRREDVKEEDKKEGVNEVVTEIVKEEVNVAAKENGQLIEIDNLAAVALAQEVNRTVSDSTTGLEWLLGLKNKFALTSERPSKRRKLLGGEAGLEKVLIPCPCEDDSSLCHFCSAGDLGSDSNRLIVCNSCNVAVHQMCYGVPEALDGSWLCVWCKQNNGSTDAKKPSCVLCPKQRGALKPVHRSVGNVGSTEFAHLFCCQWMPEVYIEDLTRMEPVMNVGGIKETRKKLICNICKVKCGACVRCSHGACRTSFHPICAREARHRMEIWGRYGCDNIELRAFCSKHSEVKGGSNCVQLGDPSVAVGSNSCISNHLPVASSTNILHRLQIGGRNGDNNGAHVEYSHTPSDQLVDSGSLETGLSDSRSNAELVSECNDAEQLVEMGIQEKNDEVVIQSDSLNFALVLKKLIDRGKVSVKDVALDIGISSNSLVSTLSDSCVIPDLKCKIANWFRKHAYMGASQKNLKVKLRSVTSSKAESGGADGSHCLSVSESDIPCPVAVKSVPLRRRTKSSIRNLNENKVVCSSKESSTDDVILIDGVKVDQLAREKTDNSVGASMTEANEKNSLDDNGVQDSIVKCSTKSEDHSEEAALHEQNSVITDQRYPVSSAAVTPLVPDHKSEDFFSFYVHPYIHNRLLQMQSEVFVDETFSLGKGDSSRLEASSNASVSCSHQNEPSNFKDTLCILDDFNLDQLLKARELGALEPSPEDEVEGEIIYFQNRLLSNAVARKHISDGLIFNITKSLPQEINVRREQKWDAVFANQYLSEIREAKKLGRKERKYKEAQAVLAAATAAAAASSRNSSFRKDSLDVSTHQEIVLSNNRAGPCSPMMPRAKDSLSRVAVSRVSLEKRSNFALLGSNISKEHPKSCDICRRSETLLNPTLTCCSCKVAVHLDCYLSVTESTGPWYCELCEEIMSSTSLGAPTVNFWEKPYCGVECGLCGGTTGAFRKSTSGQWVHAFCAEWVFESTFKRGQINLVEGMEAISKGNNTCIICHSNLGVCIKCKFGHCQITFHPTCARSAGYCMTMKTVGGKWQHKSYCEKHSSEHRAKAETQRHGVEELQSLKQIRVELERLRLLCERIIKREKVKRDIVLCSHDVLAMKRDHVAFSVLVRRPFLPPDVSSESATTSMKGHTDGYKSTSEAMQRSDDITVDSTVSVNHRIRFPVSMDSDQKTDDSSTSQNYLTRKPTERVPFSGKQIPHRASIASHNLVNGEKRQKPMKNPETFGKELIMTSDQASMKNQRLPKGYAYVPIDHLAKENQDGCGETFVEKE